MRASTLILIFAMVGASSAARTLLQSFTCPGDGNFAAGACAPQFWACGAGMATLMDCAAGTVFNPASGNCDFSGAVADCTLDPNSCPGGGAFPINMTCTASYYACDFKGAKPVTMDCPAGTSFMANLSDNSFSTCDFTQNVPGCNGVVPCTTTTALIKSNPDYSILLAALEATGLNTTLDDLNLRATILAPNNTAFEALFATLGWTAEQALSTNLATVKTVLLTHVVPFPIQTADMKNGQVLPTLNGNETLTVDLSLPGTVQLKAAKSSASILVANVTLCLSVGNAISAVLLPGNI